HAVGGDKPNTEIPIYGHLGTTLKLSRNIQKVRLTIHQPIFFSNISIKLMAALLEKIWQAATPTFHF
ncbi:MAG TPA: hypothetical protein VIJ93_02575, partial [bacterium]